MIKKKYIEKQATRKVLTDCTYICDVCGKVMKIPQHYWVVTKVDRSCDLDAIYTYDCCSIECTQELYNKYFKESQESLDNNDWIEFCHKYTHSVEEILRKLDKEN